MSIETKREALRQIEKNHEYAGVLHVRMSENDVIAYMRDHDELRILSTYYRGSFDDAQTTATFANARVYRSWSKAHRDACLFDEYFHFVKNEQ